MVFAIFSSQFSYVLDLELISYYVVQPVYHGQLILASSQILHLRGYNIICVNTITVTIPTNGVQNKRFTIQQHPAKEP